MIRYFQCIIRLNFLINKFFQKIEMNINIEKSQITTELETMRFLGGAIGRGISRKEHSEWITALLFPERPDYKLDQLQSHALSLYYANMLVESKFAQLCNG